MNNIDSKITTKNICDTIDKNYPSKETLAEGRFGIQSGKV